MSDKLMICPDARDGICLNKSHARYRKRCAHANAHESGCQCNIEGLEGSVCRKCVPVQRMVPFEDVREWIISELFGREDNYDGDFEDNMDRFDDKFGKEE